VYTVSKTNEKSAKLCTQNLNLQLCMPLFYSVQGLSCPGFDVSRVCRVQGLSCPGFVVSRVCRVQGLSVQGLSVYRLSPNGLLNSGIIR
jgi:hypothetical protein